MRKSPLTIDDHRSIAGALFTAVQQIEGPISKTGFPKEHRVTRQLQQAYSRLQKAFGLLRDLCNRTYPTDCYQIPFDKCPEVTLDKMRAFADTIWNITVKLQRALPANCPTMRALETAYHLITYAWVPVSDSLCKHENNSPAAIAYRARFNRPAQTR